MKVLVIGPSWIGDMVMSQTLYILLKKHHPNAQIDVMAPTWCLPLLNRMPEVNKKLIMPFKHGSLDIRKRYYLGQSLYNNGYKQALILPNSFKSALIPFFAKISQRTGWLGEMRYGLLNDVRKLNKTSFPLMVQRYAALAFENKIIDNASKLPNPLPWPRLIVNTKEIHILLTKFSISDNKQRPIIGFCIGAEFGGLIKCWPHYHYATLAYKLIKLGYLIILFGSAKENYFGELIITYLPKELSNYCRNLAGKTSLDQAVVLIAACKIIISNDSGLMHVASALQRPLVVLYGVTSPSFTPPLFHYTDNISFTNYYHKKLKSNKIQQYHQNLINIQPIQVIKKIEKLFLSLKENL